MKRNFVLFAAFALTAFGSSASACCLFPFFPTYSAGYPSFGVARPIIPAPNYYSASYAPAFGYYGASAYSGGNYAAGCCNTGYVTNYGAFPTLNSCGQCNTGCGTCNSCCGQYSSGFGTVGGCANGNCAGSNCVGTEIRSRPEPDSEFNQRDRDPRTFENDRDRRDDSDYDRRAPVDSDRPDPLGPDSFDRANDPSNDQNDWNPSGNDRRNNRVRPNDASGIDPMGDFDLNGRGTAPGFDELNGADDFLGRKPAVGDGAIAPTTDPMNEPVNRSSRKPPMSDPVDAETEEGEVPFEIDRDPTDVLPKTDESEAKTTSIHEGRSFVRLAGHSSAPQKSASKQISANQKKQRPVRWISLPVPAGRVRL